MRKELIISTIPQETRVAVLENEELVEFLIERHRTQHIAGNIYKGRVTKVLPGMQSAFVNIGLDRDAFLYVSDFFEDTDEYERVVASAEEEALAEGEKPRSVGGGRTSRAETPVKTEPPESELSEPARSSDRGSSRRRGEGRERKPRIPSFEPREAESPKESREPRGFRGPRENERRPGSLQVLPGESLAKYATVAADADGVVKAEREQVETEEQDLLDQSAPETRVPVADQDAGPYAAESGQSDSTEQAPVVTEETSPSEDASPEAPSLSEVREEVNGEVAIETPEPANASTAEAPAAGVGAAPEESTTEDESSAAAESDSPAEESDSSEGGRVSEGTDYRSPRQPNVHAAPPGQEAETPSFREVRTDPGGIGFERSYDFRPSAGGTGDPGPGVEGTSGQERCTDHIAHRPTGPVHRLHADRGPYRCVSEDRF